MSLTCIFDYAERMFSRHSLKRFHVSELSVQMNGHDKTSPVSDGSHYGLRVDVVVARTHIDYDRDSTGLRYSFECGNESVRGNDDLVASLDTSSEQAEPDGVETACHPDTVGRTAEGGELIFETDDLRSVCESAGVEKILDLF